jgi:hypothetical protein
VAGRQHKTYRTSEAADGHVCLGAQSIARAADSLTFIPRFFARRRVVGANDRGIDDQILKTGIIGYCLEDTPPGALRIHRLKRRNTLFYSPNASGKIAPGRVRAHDP